LRTRRLWLLEPSDGGTRRRLSIVDLGLGSRWEGRLPLACPCRVFRSPAAVVPCRAFWPPCVFLWARRRVGASGLAVGAFMAPRHGLRRSLGERRLRCRLPSSFPTPGLGRSPWIRPPPRASDGSSEADKEKLVLRRGARACGIYLETRCRRCAARPALWAPEVVTWLILPVVICLSQRLSHACLSISNLYSETANGSLNQL
jgi:hypothetical protein